MNLDKLTPVIVIEDEPLMAALISRYLESLAQSSPYQKSLSNLNTPLYHVLDSGWGLFEKDLSNVKIAVVDILLPRVTGVDLIRDFRKRYPNMGIIPISGMASEPMKREIKNLVPEVSLVPKPLRRDPFFQAFAHAWNHHLQPLPTTQIPSLEVESEVWSASKSNSNVVPVHRRKLVRRSPEKSQDLGDAGAKTGTEE